MTNASEPDAMTGYEVTLELAGQPDRTIAVNERETILAAARRAGVRLPADCHEGTCLTCVGRVLDPDSGNVVEYNRAPTALTADERATGYVLLCIAVPRTDCRIRVGPAVRSAVGDSPWG